MNIPECIGIIMDGNRRFAKEQGILSLKGHKAGYEKMKEVMEWSKDTGIKNLIFYAFSTENWKRSEKEVSYLMDLFKDALENDFKEILENNFQVMFIGERERFSGPIKSLMEKIEKESEKNTGGVVGFALSYGGRSELVQATNKLLSQNKKSITEEDIENALWTTGIPDPDIIIRTGGEKRLSNFLPWQSVYSELFFVDSFWPAFSKEEFDGIINEYSKRERRIGK